jgi:hypothetical protein
MVDGRIAERGTFEEMMANHGDFSRTFDEFVTRDQEDSEGGKVVEIEDADVDENAKKRQGARRGAAIMQAEERNVGAVNLQVYKRYFQSANGVVLLPTMFVTIVLTQTSVVLSSYWYVLSPVLIDVLADANGYTCLKACLVARAVRTLAISTNPAPLISQNSEWPRPQGFYVCLNLLSAYLCRFLTVYL